MKVAIYCRLSEEDNDKLNETDDSLSIQNQKAMMIEYASDNGWIIHDIYSDDDYAGSDRSRPEFNRLIVDAMDRKFDIVLCKTQSRFTRELELVEKYIHGLFPTLGIRFISVVDNADTEDRGNKKARQLNGLVNEWFLEDLSDNIKSVLTSRRELGMHIGSFAPYGYMKDTERKGHLIIDPEAAQVVRRIFHLFADGYGKQAIARVLNEEGIPNPTEYKRQHGMVRNKKVQSSALWRYFTISDMLTNQVYLGHMIQRKTGTASYKTQERVVYPPDQWIIVKDTHDPIIGQELWDKVQSLLEQKITPAVRQTEGIFARKVRCFHCGFRMYSIKSGEKRGFKCETHALSHDSCIGASISLRKLERIVVAQLHMLADELLNIDALEQGIDPFPGLRDKRASLESNISKIQRKIDQNNTALRSFYLDKVKGILSEHEYLEFAKQFQNEKADYETEIAELQGQIREMDIIIAKYHNKKQLVEQYVEARHLSKEMADVLINCIYVEKRDPLTKSTPVEIHWNF